ncbi:hypothetical protein METBIDRAFT_47602 [Metschnikowia bicuspidata var. bicuspidata NRRL YB-4993]|uniref:RRM domain-containing protein n=1 Tax=Metschnikowia bicuspidata var. bicuspidata NRRL YB-4993 TaxID=869754 RepID=A0A1A0H507_9ASCO|nr:hypothetical protein METBIDRAFT_47602 [Metschnikowia bicuspidata var. bicuspidata NRRL YB-4993]OBA19008.1 hypothetical protein METBIDRAFT_47602 [Metschnikowia bicuspidata var. bicuspidata NRRL YB-4993]
MPRNDGAPALNGAPPFNRSGSHVYGGHSSYGNTRPNHNNGAHSRQHHSAQNNYRSLHGVSHQSGPRPFNQKRPADAYHLAYQQTQVECQLWMGDLDPRWTENDIMGIWTEVGEAPSSVKIMRDKQGKPQYSFVTFENLEAVASALQKNRSQVPGSPRFFKLNWASGSSHGDLRAPPNRAKNSLDVGRGHSDYSLFVGDLATEVTEPELFARFSQDYPGEVKQVKIMLDPNTGASKGFGFVRFLSVDAQQKALKTMNGVVLGQRPIRLGLANGGSLDPSTSGAKKTSESVPVTAHIAQAQPALSPFTDPYNTALTIKGVISAITRDELVAHFLPFGHMIYCEIDYNSNVAYIKYLLRTSAERALLFMHGMVVNGSRLVLRWGRSKISTEGITRSTPSPKGGVYTAAEKPPTIYHPLSSHVVFEDLDREQIDELNFFADLQLMSVKDLNDADIKRLQEREKYLDNAF